MAKNYGVIDLDKLDEIIRNEEDYDVVAVNTAINFKNKCLKLPSLQDVWNAARNGIDNTVDNSRRYDYTGFLDYINSSEFKK